MRYMTCLLAAGILLSLLAGLAREKNRSQACKPSCERVVIKLYTGRKIEGRYQRHQCDEGGTNCGAQIIRNGTARRIPQSEVELIQFKKSFGKRPEGLR